MQPHNQGNLAGLTASMNSLHLDHHHLEDNNNYIKTVVAGRPQAEKPEVEETKNEGPRESQADRTPLHKLLNGNDA